MSVLDVIFPKRCLSCGAWGGYLCRACKARLPAVAPNEAICAVCGKLAVGGVTHPGCRGRYTLDGLASAFWYRGIMRTVIKTVKYRHVFDGIASVVDAMPLPQAVRHSDGTPCLVPIPLHASRLRERGFNQATLIARALSRRLGMPLAEGVLVRTRKTAPQASLGGRALRAANVARAFAVPSGVSVPSHIVLVDDVFTTGATMRAAANVLKRRGAMCVWAVTIAR